MAKKREEEQGCSHLWQGRQPDLLTCPHWRVLLETENGEEKQVSASQAPDSHRTALMLKNALSASKQQKTCEY